MFCTSWLCNGSNISDLSGQLQPAPKNPLPPSAWNTANIIRPLRYPSKAVGPSPVFLPFSSSAKVYFQSQLLSLCATTCWCSLKCHWRVWTFQNILNHPLCVPPKSQDCLRSMQLHILFSLFKSLTQKLGCLFVCLPKKKCFHHLVFGCLSIKPCMHLKDILLISPL